MNDGCYCTFHVGPLLLGVAIDRIQEVLRDQLVTPVPLAHADVAGLLNIRGQIVTAIDARRRFGLPAAPDAAASTTVVIRSHGEAVGLVVDRAADVVSTDIARRHDVPETVDGRIGRFLDGAYQHGDELLLVLDADHALAVTS